MMMKVESNPQEKFVVDAVRTPWASVAAIAGLQAVLFGWFTRKGWFWIDDFLFLSEARRAGAPWSFLRRPLYEHFSPVHRVFDFALVHLSGMSWIAAEAVLLTLALACTCAFAHLAAGMFCSSRVVVFATVAYALSLFVARAMTWWTGGVHILSLTLFSLLAFDGYVRWVRHRGSAALWLSVGAYALALLTHEQAMLIPGFLALVRLVLLEPQPMRMRTWTTVIRNELVAWCAYGALTIASLANFLAFYHGAHPAPSVGELARFLWVAFAGCFVPTIFLLAMPEPRFPAANLAVTIGIAVGVALVALSFVSRQRVGRLWAFFATSFVLAVVPLGLARISEFGVVIGREPRYEMAPAFLLPLTLGVLAGRPTRRRGQGVIGRRIPLVCLGAAALLFLRTAPSASVARESSAPKAFFARFESDVAATRARGVEPVLFNRIVPEAVVPRWLAAINQYRYVVPLVDPTIRIDEDDAAFVVDRDGRLRPAAFTDGVDVPLPGPAKGDCPARLTAGAPIRLPVTPTRTGTALMTRVRVRSGSGRLTVIAGDASRFDPMAIDVPSTPSARYAWVSVPSVSYISLQSEGPGTVCVAEVVLGAITATR